MICRICKEHKNISDFENLPSGGTRKICRMCKRKQDTDRYAKNPEKYRKAARDYRSGRELELELKRFSMTIDDFNIMFESQNGVCAICRKAEDGRRLSIDHDHSCCPGRKSCGKCVRSLLCNNCNNGIGRFFDDAENLRRAAGYIERFR